MATVNEYYLEQAHRRLDALSKRVYDLEQKKDWSKVFDEALGLQPKPVPSVGDKVVLVEYEHDTDEYPSRYHTVVVISEEDRGLIWVANPPLGTVKVPLNRLRTTGGAKCG